MQVMSIKSMKSNDLLLPKIIGINEDLKDTKHIFLSGTTKSNTKTKFSNPSLKTRISSNKAVIPKLDLTPSNNNYEFQFYPNTTRDTKETKETKETRDVNSKYSRSVSSDNNSSDDGSDNVYIRKMSDHNDHEPVHSKFKPNNMIYKEGVSASNEISILLV